MYILPKSFFLAGGALLTLISAFVTGYVVSRRDTEAVKQLYAIQEQLESQFQTRNNGLVKERDELRAANIAIELSTDRAKYIGLSFQISGLIIILLKDLFYG